MLSQIQAGNVGSLTDPAVMYPVMSAVRIRSLTMWMPQLPSGAPFNPVSFMWLSDLGAPKRTTRLALSSIATSFTTTPPRGSRAGMWSTAGSAAATLQEVLFVLDVQDSDSTPAQIVISIDVDYIMATNSTSELDYTLHASVPGIGLFGNYLDVLTTSPALGPLTLYPVGLPLFTNAANIAALTRVDPQIY